MIAEATGLHFPRERWPDLQRGLAAAARELGFDGVASCLESLLSGPLNKAQLEVLASHLTVGETFFLRDAKLFAVLADRILPDLVRSRVAGERRLRLWSAGCCTGEEPYSLAILLHQTIPGLAQWNATVLATDINGNFLRKAAAGVYGEWSFRDVPAWWKDRYFRRRPDGRYALLPEIKKLVTFAPLNLAEDAYPTVVNDTNAMDLILCRNVLMYFTPAQAQKAARNLHRALVDGGWLVVSPSEASHSLFSHFATVNFPGVILYRKGDAKVLGSQTPASAPGSESGESVVPPFTAEPPGVCSTGFQPAVWPISNRQSATLGWDAAPAEPPSVWSAGVQPAGSPISNRQSADHGRDTDSAAHPEDQDPATHQVETQRLSTLPPQEPAPAEIPPTPLAMATALHAQGRYAQAADILLASFAQQTPEAQAISLLARALANQGRLAEALAWCDRWVVADKLDPAGHYLRAVILLEQGDTAQARSSLHRAVYLQPQFVLAHFTLGNLAFHAARSRESEKHFRNALRLLQAQARNQILPESDGLTAGRLTEIIASVIGREAVA